MKRMAIKIPITVTTIMMKIMIKQNSIKEIVKRAHNDTQHHKLTVDTPQTIMLFKYILENGWIHKRHVLNPRYHIHNIFNYGSDIRQNLYNPLGILEHFSCLLFCYTASLRNIIILSWMHWQDVCCYNINNQLARVDSMICNNVRFICELHDKTSCEQGCCNRWLP